MPYGSCSRITRFTHLALTCPHLVADIHCAGGDYCPFPHGDEKLCCFFCPRFNHCPDPAGICRHFIE